MADLRPRIVAHRGNVYASGFIIGFHLVHPREARRRILAAWQPGAIVYRLEAGLALVLPSPILVSVEEAIGTPLVWNHTVLTGAPLTKEQIAGRSGSIAYVIGGALVYRRLSELPIEEIENWIDVGALQFERGVPFQRTAVKPRPVAEPVVTDIRVTLKNIPEQSATAARLIDRLKGKAAAEPHLREKVSWSRVLNFLRSLVPSQAAPGQTTVTSSRVALWINAVATRLTMITRLSRLLGWRQARYVGQIFEMFESGDINAALRHAIPLTSISESPALRVSLGLPSPRRTIRINPWSHGGTSAIGIVDSVYRGLEQLYRQAFRRLEAQGRIEEAAFVLAELMRANEEAVAFLERHGKLREAAEIAEGRQLPPELVVRQWYIAGEIQRAIRIARKTGAFPGAVTSLEKSRHPLAASLRRDWAHTLADAGNYAAAVDVLWPLQSERTAAVGWMKKTVAIGGVAAGRNLARLLAIPHDELQAYWERACSLLQNDSVEEAATRAEFANALCAQPASLQTQTIARAAVRSLVRDAGRGMQSLGSNGLRRLIHYSDDAALHADVSPQVAAGRAAALRETESLQHLIQTTYRAAVQIHDVVALPNGGYVLALGEAGLRIVTRDGRTVSDVDQPAFHLVPSHNSSRVIAIAPRGNLSMLSRFDVLSRKTIPWCLSEVTAFANSFDGITWYVASDGDVYALDATSPTFEALWRIPDIGMPAGPLTLTSSTLSFVTRLKDEFWFWQYQIPGMRLTGKTCVARSSDGSIAESFSACADSSIIRISDAFRTASWQAAADSWKTVIEVAEDESVSISSVTERWITLRILGPAYARVSTYSMERGSMPFLRLEVLLEGDGEPIVRTDDTLLTVAYNGSVHTYELGSGSRIRTIRV